MAMHRHTFLSEWFSDCEGNIEIRVLPGAKQEFFTLDDYQGIDAFSSKHSKKNIYFGVASRNGAGGTKANIVSIPGVWADIDFKSIPQEEADKLLLECPLLPTSIINSGNGYHCYWKFREPTDNQEITEYINRQLAQYFGSDPVHDVTRILRLPDTPNHKYKPWRPVRILIHNRANQYNESDFQEHFPPVKDTAKAGEPSNPRGWQEEALKGATPGHRHHTAAKLAGRYIKNGLSDQEILPILQDWDRKNSPSIESDYGQGELLKIIQSIRKTDNRSRPTQINLTQKVRNWIEMNPGAFFTRQIYDELSISKTDKDKISVIMSRLIAEGVIERTGQKAGCFRTIDSTCEAIDWRKTEIETFDINLPLGISNLVSIYPKNIVIIYGEPDAGKTALMLNIVDFNRDKEIFYFSSEMGGGELHDRISKFPGAEESWSHFHAFERSDNFSDVIRPDAINIIDYLELTDNFYLVAGKVMEIFKKLRKGITIIGLQMAPGGKLGRGGAFSLEKARLNMTISKNPPDGAILRIVKAKKRARPDLNPNNQRCDFKLVNGTRLILTKDWHYDYDGK